MPPRLVNIDRDTPLLLPPDLRDWIDPDDPLHFILEVIGQMKIDGLHYNNRGSGSKQMPPRTLLALIFFCYSIGVTSARKMQRMAAYDLRVRYLLANHVVHHKTISKFRRENAEVVQDINARILLLAREAGLLKLGKVAVDSTPIKADASDRRTVSAKRAEQLIEEHRKLIEHFKQKAADLHAEGIASDSEDDDPDDGAQRLPENLKSREAREAELKAAIKRLEKQEQRIKDAAQRLAARAQATAERHAAKHERDKQRHAHHAALAAKRGERIGRVPNKPVPPDPAKARDSLTDPDSRIVGKAGNLMRGYSAQAVVDAEGSMLILGGYLAEENGDMGRLIEVLDSVDPTLGRPSAVLADTGYAKALDILDLEADPDHRVECFVAPNATPRGKLDMRDLPEPGKKGSSKKSKKRKPSADQADANRRSETHGPEAGSEAKASKKRTTFHPKDPTLAAMRAKLDSEEGRAIYQLRQQTVEPAFGILKEPMGLRSFRLRGRAKCEIEYGIARGGYNLRRMAKMLEAAKASQAA